LLRRAQDAMGGATKLAAIRDTTHVMDITLERAAGGSPTGARSMAFDEGDTKMLELRVAEYRVNTGLNAADLSRR
jgi:hypothetical protein